MISKTSRGLRASLVATCFSLCAMLLAQPAFSGSPGSEDSRGHLNRLLNNQAVISHLGLTDDQVQAAQKISVEVLDSHRTDFERAMVPEAKAERVALVAQVYVSANDQTFDRLKDVFSAEQHQRLQQIDVQTFGMRAFGRPAVIAYLGLTASQQGELKALADKAGQKLSAIHKSSLPAAEKAASAREARGAALREASQYLSAPQWVKWELLTGAEFAP